MAEEKKEPWLGHMALVTVLLAVGATLSTFKGGGYSTQAVINQALASDQWAFYQAKSTKQSLHELQLQLLTLQAMSLTDPGVRKAYNERIEAEKREVERYSAEKKEIENKARDFEVQRDAAKRHGQPFGMAVIFLQVAILLNSIAGLMKLRRVWYAAIPVGLVGLVLFVQGFLL